MQAATSVALLLMSVSAPQGFAQQVSPTTTQTMSSSTAEVPQAPTPKLTEPLFLRDTGIDYTKPKRHFWNPLAPYTATNVPLPRLGNTPRLDSLVRDGKIYLSLSDAVTLALENNYDIAIARINLDIADTDLLRARAGSTLRGVSTGLVTGTLGGTSNLLFSGGKSSLTTDTSTYNFGYTQGFLTGTQLAATFNNTRITTNNPFSDYSPDITTTFRA
jgi:outer membrane protein